MKPGATTRPDTSIVVVPASGVVLTAAICRPRIPTWRTAVEPRLGIHDAPACEDEIKGARLPDLASKHRRAGQQRDRELEGAAPSRRPGSQS